MKLGRLIFCYHNIVPDHNISVVFCVSLSDSAAKLRIYCDPQQSERETACEIYSVVRLVCGFVVGLASQVVHHQKLVCVDQLGVSIFF